MIKVIRWLNKYVLSDKPIMKDIILFKYFIIGRHFKGCDSYAIDGHIKGFWFNNFKPIDWGPDFKKVMNTKTDYINISLRLGKPIITFTTRPQNHFRNVDVLE